MYEWNTDKSRSNRKKHGVAFEAAAKVFTIRFCCSPKTALRRANSAGMP